MRAARQTDGKGCLLPHPNTFRHRAGLLDFNPGRRRPLAPAESVTTVNEPPAPFFQAGSPGTSIYHPSITVSGPSLRVTRVTRRRPVRPKNCFRSPVSLVFRSMVMTGPGGRISLVLGRPLDNYILTEIATPVDLSAVIEIQNGRIGGRGIRAPQRAFEEFGHPAVAGSGDDFPVGVEYAPEHRGEGKQANH